MAKTMAILPAAAKSRPSQVPSPARPAWRRSRRANHSPAKAPGEGADQEPGQPEQEPDQRAQRGARERLPAGADAAGAERAAGDVDREGGRGEQAEEDERQRRRRARSRRARPPSSRPRKTSGAPGSTGSTVPAAPTTTRSSGHQPPGVHDAESSRRSASAGRSERDEGRASSTPRSGRRWRASWSAPRCSRSSCSPRGSTGSVALLSDALESVVNVVAAAVLWARAARLGAARRSQPPLRPRQGRVLLGRLRGDAGGARGGDHRLAGAGALRPAAAGARARRRARDLGQPPPLVNLALASRSSGSGGAGARRRCSPTPSTCAATSTPRSPSTAASASPGRPASGRSTRCWRWPWPSTSSGPACAPCASRSAA